MHTLTATLLVLSALVLFVQGGSIPANKINAIEETKAGKIVNNGVRVETGYEGYIATIDSQKSKKSDYFSLIDNFTKSDLLTKISMLKSGLVVVGKSLLPLVLKVAGGVKLVTSILTAGFLITMGVCKFTSLCSFNVNMPFQKQEVEARIKNVASPYLSEETLNDIMGRVRSALGFFDEIQDLM